MMSRKTVRFSIPHKPNCLNFAKPICRLAHLFCCLIRRDALSPTDLSILQIIGKKLGFLIEISCEKDPGA